MRLRDPKTDGEDHVTNRLLLHTRNKNITQETTAFSKKIRGCEGCHTPFDF